LQFSFQKNHKLEQIEIHPFGAFLPQNLSYLIVGTFPGKQYSQLPKEEVLADPLAWSYAGKNQFWRIMENIYEISLPDRKSKQLLFSQLGIGMMDLIYSCSRKNNTNLDNNLINITWNKAAFETFLQEKNDLKIFCTGKGVADILKKWFPEHEAQIIALPSPSPIYASMKLEAKITFYKSVFPPKL
jgi:hypoxanthine-DNA glycosylase